MARGPRAALFAGALTVIAVGVFVVAALLADAATEQPGERITPAIDDPVLSPGAVVIGMPSEDHDPGAPGGDPGAAGGQVVDPSVSMAGAHLQVEPAGAAMTGMGDGTWLLPDELVGDVPDEAPADAGGAPGPGVPAPIATPQDAVSVAERLGDLSLEPPPLITRFVDLCADGATPCPSGIGATVVPLGGPVPETLAAMIWPGLSTGAAPALRCQPGFHTSERYPVVITTSAPVARLDVTLTLEGLGVLHETTLVTAADEQARWQEAVDRGAAVGVDLAAGVQHCVALPTELAPENLARYPGAVLPDPRTYRIDAFAVAAHGAATVRVTSSVTPPTPGPRPPTTVVPINGHVVQVRTAERPETTSRARVTWLGTMGATPEAVCGQLWGTSGPFESGPSSVEVPAGILEQPGYPYDRSWTRSGIRNVVVPEAYRGALCLEWDAPTGPVREAWRIESPDGFRPRVSVQNGGEILNPLPKDVQRDWVVSAPGAGCPRTTVFDQNDSDDHTTGGSPQNAPFFCDSHGLPFPAVTTIVLEVFETEGRGYRDMGQLRVLTPGWCHSGPFTMQEAMAGAAVGWSLLVCGPTQYAIEAVWRDQNVLCGGDCPQYDRLRTPGLVVIDENDTNGRRGQLDWIISGPG